MTKLAKDDAIIFGLSNSINLAKDVSEATGIELGEYKQNKYSDGELFLESSSSVREKSVFIIQSTNSPANDSIMELLLFIDALRRSSAREINIIIPYFGYARQDRKISGRQPISAKLVANLLTVAGATRVLTFDIHSEQIVGFFDIPMDNLKAQGLIGREIEKMNIEDLVIVSPDHGGVARARSVAKLLNATIAVVDKRRTGPNEVESSYILGDVKGKNAIIYDDMVDTGGTIVEASKLLLAEGVKTIRLAVTHAVFSKKEGVDPVQKIKDIGVKEIIVTNSIEHKSLENLEGVKVIDLSNIIAESIQSHINGESITDHFIKKYNTKL